MLPFNPSLFNCGTSGIFGGCFSLPGSPLSPQVNYGDINDKINTVKNLKCSKWSILELSEISFRFGANNLWLFALVHIYKLDKPLIYKIVKNNIPLSLNRMAALDLAAASIQMVGVLCHHQHSFKDH